MPLQLWYASSPDIKKTCRWCMMMFYINLISTTQFFNVMIIMSIINSILLHVRSVIHRCPIEYIYYKLMPCYVAVAVAVAVTEVEAEDKENWLSVPGFIFSTESSFFLWTQSAHKITSINNNSIKIWYYNEINYNVINIIIKKYNRERERGMKKSIKCKRSL